MAYATKDGAHWRELPAGADVVVGDVVTSYASVLSWTPQFRTARGIKEIEDTPPPAGKVIVSSSIEDQGGKPVRIYDLQNLPTPAMAGLRAEALATAIAYGNRITQGEIGQWAGVEPFSWAQQRDEAKVVRDGTELGEDAILPHLAADKGVSVQSYADDVWANAMRYQAVLRGAVQLRRLATSTLSDEALDTPEKLAAAVAQLTVIADELAAQLLGGGA